MAECTPIYNRISSPYTATTGIYDKLCAEDLQRYVLLIDDTNALLIGGGNKLAIT